MSFIIGQDVVLAEYHAGSDAWVMWGCARSITLSVDTEFIDTTTSGAGDYTDRLPVKHSFSGTMQGLVKLNPVGMYSLPDIRDKQLGKEKLLMRFVRTDTGGVDEYTTEGYFYIQNTTDESGLNGMNSFTVEIVGTGALTETFTPTEIISNVHRFQYTGIAGETSFTAVTAVDGTPINLTGKTVLGLEVDGIGFSKMITSGTPVDKEFKFVTATGTLEVPVPLDAGIEVYGYYRN